MKRKALPAPKAKTTNRALVPSEASLEAKMQWLLGEISSLYGCHGQTHLGDHLASQLMYLQNGRRALQGKGSDVHLDSLFLAVETLLAIKPRNALEAMLTNQMVGVHNAAIHAMSSMRSDGLTMEQGQIYSDRAVRLMNLFNRQLETLQKLRGKHVQQKVVVEHVNVEPGAKAFLGFSPAKGANDVD